MASNTQDIDTESETAITTGETESGLDENVAGALSYLFGLVSGLIFYLIEQDNPFVRFHAAQSMVLSGLLFVVYVALSIVGTVVSSVLFTSTSTFFVGSIISLVIGLIWLVLTLGTFALWVYLMVRAYQGKTQRVPIAAGIADNLV
ncbi:DUF4870 domain-containing protein [Halococcus saccharolyticus]|uniref:DUF4870 domain-containing protein n=1 Tax=Halococcus saccharolyticus DSM 5350 TaxID=1227455 RepID=M0MI85_9EURY|nr:DUF4870 domain-containing protein [Halococcus saccharolyticus]EMA45406.1 hypothetical protein C449_07275 [Halococcus saccharolyticus DSM 5350]